MFQNDLRNEPVITLWNGVELLWVEAPHTVLFADKCCFTGKENQYTLCLTLGTQLQYMSFHEQYYTTVTCVVGLGNCVYVNTW